jgi:hypothetical protein|nr:MAG TPA: hypothetical protein [Caudoviricetes sp.]
MWKNININKQNIQYETEKAILIKLPNSSEYKGYCFWHPLKLVKPGRHRNAVSIIYNDSFTFKIFRKEQTRYIKVPEFEGIFEVMNDNIIAPGGDYYLEIVEPTKINKEVEILECLKNNN